MRLTLSLFCTLIGVTVVYLFATGALAAFVSDGDGVARVAERVLAPFASAGPEVATVLAAGLAFFAVGMLIAPRADIWIAFTEERDGAAQKNVQESISQYGRDSSRERVFEIALLLNGLVVLALLGFIGVSAWQPEMTAVTGALYCVGLLEALLGTVLLIYLIVRRKRSARRAFRPLLAASAGLNFLEIAFLFAIFACGAIG